MKSRKMVLMNLFAGQQWGRRHREQAYGQDKGGEGEGEMNGESSMEAYSRPYVTQIASGNLLCDSGNSNWGSIVTWERAVGKGGRREGGSRGRGHMYTYG